MRIGFKGVLIGVALVSAAAGAVISMSVIGAAGQAKTPTRIGGKPNLSGIWQTNNEAYWDLEAHEARPGAVTQPGFFNHEFGQVPAAPSLPFGAAGGVAGSIGVVDGDGKIPYKPEALKIKQDNAAHWIDRDPELKCYLPGTPRGMYMPYPIQLTQSTNKIHVAYSFAAGARTIHLDTVDNPPDDTWMGHSLGRWEGDTLVVDVRHFNDRTWFDRAGNFHSEALHVVERFSLMTPDIIRYEATIEDPKTFTRPWKISMPLYRRVEPNMQLLEYRCTEFVEEFLLGMLRRDQLVKRWDSETMTIDITRKIPPGDRFYDWYGK
jgi:hypothetical protein